MFALFMIIVLDSIPELNARTLLHSKCLLASTAAPQTRASAPSVHTICAHRASLGTRRRITVPGATVKEWQLWVPVVDTTVIADGFQETKRISLFDKKEDFLL
jgi:hypothetical protein